MRRLNFYFTLIVFLPFISIQAQKKTMISANYSIIKTQPLFKKLTNSTKLLAYINKEGIEFKTKIFRIIVW